MRSSRGETAGKATRGEAVSDMDTTVGELRAVRYVEDDTTMSIRVAQRRDAGVIQHPARFGTKPGRHYPWKSKALKPVTISSRPRGRVTGGSARAKQPTRSQSLQAGPTGVADG